MSDYSEEDDGTVDYWQEPKTCAFCDRPVWRTGLCHAHAAKDEAIQRENDRTKPSKSFAGRQRERRDN